MWLFDIVSNKRNSIDVDKFDYITRDKYMLGLKQGTFDYKLLLKSAKVIDD
jgi:HD superfamily phosphohydrolase